MIREQRLAERTPIKQRIQEYANNPVHHKAHKSVTTGVRPPKNLTRSEQLELLMNKGGTTLSEKMTLSPSMNHKARQPFMLKKVFNVGGPNMSLSSKKR